jgi:hypothetical protein
MSLSILELEEKDTTPNLMSIGEDSIKLVAVSFAALSLSGIKSFAVMLWDTSIAITKEKVLDSWVVWTLNPETANTKHKTITMFKIKITTFFEKKSIPCILEIASKFANLRAVFFRLPKAKK